MKSLKLSYLLILIVLALLLSDASVNAELDSNPQLETVWPNEHEPSTYDIEGPADDKQENATPFQTEILKTLSTVANQQKATYEQPDAKQNPWWSESRIQIGLLVVAAIYTFFAALQWWAIRRQSNIASKTLTAINLQAQVANDGIIEARRAADAAQKSAEVAERSLTLIERPWVKVSFDEHPNPTQHPHRIAYNISNGGRTPAKIKIMEILGYNVVKNLPDFEIKPKPSGPIDTRITILPGETFTHIYDAQAIDSSHIQNIHAETEMLIIRGWVIYDDIFDVRHVTRFCRVYHPAMGFIFPRQEKPGYNDGD